MGKGIKLNMERYGKWSENIQAFWCGGNDTEYVAWKGSHQILVYPCGMYPSPPSEVIQHTQRIESVEEFDAAMENGIRFKTNYIDVGIGAFYD